MESVGVALIGCGFMGRRHLLGLAKLHEAGLLRAKLVAVFDLHAEAAENMAEEALRLLGHKPRVHTALESLLADSEVVAVDIVTDPATHGPLAVACAEAGRHVLCEKPLALTVRSARQMVEAAAEHGVHLATGENYRRGGSNRLARAVLDAGVLGNVHLMVEASSGGDRNIILSKWRHLKQSGSIALDMGVHYADIIEYYLGPVELAWGRGIIAEPIRIMPDGSSFEATGEDSFFANLRTLSGVDVQFSYLPSGPGRKHWQRSLHGDKGSMFVPRDRTNGQVEVHLADGTLTGERLRSMVGSHFQLDEVTRAVLGPDGIGHPGDAWADVDAGYLAVELADFFEAIIDGRPPEVDGIGGLRALAVMHAIFESGIRSEPIRVDDVVSGVLHAYQDDIDRHLGVIS